MLFLYQQTQLYPCSLCLLTALGYTPEIPFLIPPAQQPPDYYPTNCRYTSCEASWSHLHTAKGITQYNPNSFRFPQGLMQGTFARNQSLLQANQPHWAGRTSCRAGPWGSYLLISGLVLLSNECWLPTRLLLNTLMLSNSFKCHSCLCFHMNISDHSEMVQEDCLTLGDADPDQMFHTSWFV